MSSSKPLKIIFGILLVIITAELLIYYYIQSNHQIFYSSKKNLINKTKSNQNISKGTDSDSDYKNYLTRMIRIATNEKLKYKRYFLVYEIKGKLIKIDTEGKNSPNPSLMKFGLYIKSEENTEEDNIYLPPAILSKTKVYLVQNNVEKLIGTNQLKEGDVISLQYFEVLSYKISDRNRDDYVVIKINK